MVSALMVAALLAHPGIGIAYRHIRIAYAASMLDIGRVTAKKALHLVAVIGTSLWQIQTWRPDVVYYPPGGPDTSGLFRDMAWFRRASPLSWPNGSRGCWTISVCARGWNGPGRRCSKTATRSTRTSPRWTDVFTEVAGSPPVARYGCRPYRVRRFGRVARVRVSTEPTAISPQGGCS